MDTIKKICKIVAIVAAIAGIACAVYALIKKFCPKCCEEGTDDQCDYVSCSCFEEEVKEEPKEEAKEEAAE